jgi:hypothetical protein
LIFLSSSFIFWKTKKAFHGGCSGTKFQKLTVAHGVVGALRVTFEKKSRLLKILKFIRKILKKILTH